MNISETSQTLYLLNDRQFQKFSKYLQPRTNDDFIKKLQEKHLIYSQKYYPILKTELEIIKNSLIQERDKENTEAGDIADDSVSNNSGNNTSISVSTNDNPSASTNISASASVSPSEDKSKNIDILRNEKKRNSQHLESFFWMPTKWDFYKKNKK